MKNLNDYKIQLTRINLAITYYYHIIYNIGQDIYNLNQQNISSELLTQLILSNNKLYEDSFSLFIQNLIIIIKKELVMIPDNLKNMFGLNNKKDLNMANNIWKMLDEMSDSDPQTYKKFIQKNLNQGLQDAKAQKQQKEKPFKIIPCDYLMLEMDANLSERVLEDQPEFHEKLNLNKEKWAEVKDRLPSKIRLGLNICFSNRVKVPTKKITNQPILNFELQMLKDIQCLYYSMQGPLQETINETGIKQKLYYCMIFNDNFIKAFDKVQSGKKILIGLAISYFQERLQRDKNPLLKQYDPNIHRKLLSYSIQKISLVVSQKKFKYGKDEKPIQFLLEPQVDLKPRDNNSKNNSSKPQKVAQPKQIIAMKKSIQSQKKVNPFLIVQNPKQQQKQQMITLLPEKKVEENTKKLVQILDSKEQIGDQIQDTRIPYQIKESQGGYSLEFLVHGITKISELDLQINQKILRLKTLGQSNDKYVEVKFDKAVDANSVKAKMKKKSHLLSVNLTLRK